MARRAGSLSSVVALLLTVLCQTASPQGVVSFAADFATFRSLNSDSLTYLEVYLRVDYTSLKTSPSGGAGCTATVILLSQVGDTVKSIRQRPEQSSRNDDLTTVFGIEVVPGNYLLATEVRDEYGFGRFVRSDPIVVRRYDTGAQNISDIELASAVLADTARTIFSKAGVRLMPHPTRSFGYEASVLYFYAELYGYSGEEPVQVTAYVEQPVTHQIIKSLGPFAAKPAGKIAVVLQGFNTMGLADGDYNLRITAPRSEGDSATVSTHFTVLRQRAKQTAPSLIPEQVQQFLSDVEYLISNRERIRFMQATPVLQYQLAEAFWRSRDPNSATPHNEAKIEHERRLRYVDDYFSTARTTGRKSDRGRAYIVYGPPDQITREQGDIRHRAYEVWFYYRMQGGAQFVFMEQMGSGRDRRLVHSTARNEVSNEDWQRMITVGGSSRPSPTTR